MEKQKLEKIEEPWAHKMLRELVLEHKKRCKRKECDISTSTIYIKFYEPGFKRASEFFKDFM